MSIYMESSIALREHCIARQEQRQEIDTDAARAICYSWHGGESSAFYSFVSTKHYDRAALLDELSTVISEAYDHVDSDDKLELDMLGTYFLNRKD